MKPNPKVMGILSDVSAFLTMLAMIPYELGPAAEYLPPNIKAWTVGIGVFSTFGLRLIKRWCDPVSVPGSDPLTK
jgi:hypothetical protein